MADSISFGFGSSPAVTLNPGDTIVRIIQAPVSGLVRIRTIDVAMLQIGGIYSATSFAPVTIVRGGEGLGTGGKPGNIVAPFHPTGTALPGFPQIPDLSGLELLGQFNVRVQSPIPRNYGPNDLYVKTGDKIAVIVSSLVDASTNAPASNLSCGAALTVLGDVELDIRKVDNRLGQIRSLPR